MHRRAVFLAAAGALALAALVFAPGGPRSVAARQSDESSPAIQESTQVYLAYTVNNFGFTTTCG